MRVLVTGGAGYIGSHTCKKLFSLGHQPITIDNLVNGHKHFVKWGPFYEGDIKNTEQVVEIIAKEKIEAVMHFAAHAYVGESNENPVKYYENNTAGTISLLNSMNQSKVQKFILSSTCATYGVPSKNPIDESMSQDPINPYGSSKFMIEQVLKDLEKTNNWSITVLRYFNAAGADIDGEIGEDHTPETHLIPLALKACHDPNFELTIFGDDYPTEDGSCVRDYVHVSDLADAHVSALKSLDNKGIRFFNLGAAQGISIIEILQMAEKVTGKKPKIKTGKRRAGDPPVLIASNQLAKNILGWTPINSQIENIMRTANNWYMKSQNN